MTFLLVFSALKRTNFCQLTWSSYQLFSICLFYVSLIFFYYHLQPHDPGENSPTSGPGASGAEPQCLIKIYPIERPWRQRRRCRFCHSDSLLVSVKSSSLVRPRLIHQMLSEHLFMSEAR